MSAPFDIAVIGDGADAERAAALLASLALPLRLDRCARLPWATPFADHTATPAAAAQTLPVWDAVLLCPPQDAHPTTAVARLRAWLSDTPTLVLLTHADDARLSAWLDAGADDAADLTASQHAALAIRRTLRLAQERRARLAASMQAAESAPPTPQPRQDDGADPSAQTITRMLAQAAELLATSQNDGPPLEQIAQLTLPVLADWCVIDQPHGVRGERGLHAAHGDAERTPLVHTLMQQFPFEVHAPAPLRRCLERGHTVRIATLAADKLRRWLPDPEPRALLDRVGFGSVLAVPLYVRTEWIGTLLLVRDAARAPFSEADERLASELASRIALALDHQRLLRESRERVTQLAATERALRTSERRFRSLVQNSSDIILEIDANGVIRYVSPSIQRILGHEPATLLGATTAALIHPEDGQRVMAVVHAALEEAEPRFSIELRCRHRDGSWRLVEAIGNGLTETDTGALVISVRDITERRQADDARRFLAEAGAALTSTLDLRATLQRLTALAVPSLADCATVDMLNPDGLLERIAITSSDAEVEQFLTDLYREPLAPTSEYRPIDVVLRTGLPLLKSELDEATLVMSAHHEAHLALMRDRLASVMLVPLTARGETLGVLQCARWATSPRYTLHDLAVAEDLARRAAIAIDNARLFEEAQHAKEQLRYQLDFSLAITGSLTGGICALDSAGNVTFANPAAERMLGWREVELLGQNLHAIVHPHHTGGEPAAACAGLLATDTATPTRTDDDLFARRDGSRFPVAYTTSAIVMDGGINGGLISFQDISQRKQVEAELNRAQAHLRTIVANAPVRIFAVDAGGVLTLSEGTGLEPRGGGVGIVGRSVFEVYRDVPAMLQQVQGALRGETCTGTVKIGETVFDARVVPVRDADGRVTGVVGAATDVTERKRAEEALEASAARFAAQKAELDAILTHLGDGLVLADARGQVTYLNPAAQAIFGDCLPTLPAPEADLWPPDHDPDSDADATDATARPRRRLLARRAARLPLARALAGERGPARDLSLRVGGVLRTVSVSAAPLTTRDGISGAVAVLRDVTEMRRTQERVVESDRLRALGEMASGVAHDFNNLLAVILGRVELLVQLADQTQAGDGTDGSAGRGAGLRHPVTHYEVIRQAALDGAETVKRLQTFSGVARPPVEEAMDLARVVHDVVEFTRPRWKDGAQAAGITIHMHTDVAPLPVVSGSPAAVREVLVNLVFNAVDAMPQGGSITIAVQPTTDGPGSDTPSAWTAGAMHKPDAALSGVAITVTDTGVGMAESVRRRIFEPFFTTKGTRGAGLGLSMSYGIVARVGGTIAVTSTLGVGTSFRVWLPVRAVDAVESEPPVLVGRGLRVLVVDDEPQMLETARLLLELAGHHVTIAQSGAEALALLGIGTPASAHPSSPQTPDAAPQMLVDVVLTDLGMPGLNGLQVVAALRAAAVMVPCVLVTGWGMELTPADVQLAGAQAVLPKPFSAAQLYEVIDQVIQEYTALSHSLLP